MPLNDVSYLCITIGSFKDHLAPELANLFRRMPNLSTLRMKCNPLPESHVSTNLCSPLSLYILPFSFLELLIFFFLVPFSGFRVWHGVLENAKPCFYFSA